MRMGTQTLIQALQAIPWDEDRADDEIGHGPHVRGSMISSDDEGDERTGSNLFIYLALNQDYLYVIKIKWLLLSIPFIGLLPDHAVARPQSPSQGHP